VEDVDMDAYSEDELMEAFQEEVRGDELASPEAKHLRIGYDTRG
jgi:hypothetical protein